MRENRPYGLEGGESGSTGLPYPYRSVAASVATCRQTVEAFSLATSTAWQRMATVGSGIGSHLSPDGGGFP